VDDFGAVSRGSDVMVLRFDILDSELRIDLVRIKAVGVVKTLYISLRHKTGRDLHEDIASEHKTRDDPGPLSRGDFSI
jgi:hypothetical protein